MASITIVVPIRNCEATLPRLLECYGKLKRKEDALLRFEIQPCTDKSVEIIEAAAKKDRSISFEVHSLPLGAGYLRKFGALSVSTEYVCFSDGDDYFDENFIADYLTAFEQTGAEAVDVSFFLDRPSKEPSKYAFRGKEAILSPLQAERMLLNDISMRSFLWCKAFKRSLFDYGDLIFGEPRHIFEDLGLCFSLFYHCASVAYLNCASYHYVKGAASLTSSHYIDRPLQHLQAFAAIREFILTKNDQELIKAFKKTYWRSKLSFNYDVRLARKAGARWAWLRRWRKEFKKVFRF